MRESERGGEREGGRREREREEGGGGSVQANLKERGMLIRSRFEPWTMTD